MPSRTLWIIITGTGDTGNHVHAFVVLRDRPAQGVLEWPGEPEQAELLPGDVAKAREGAVQYDATQFRFFVPFHPFAGQGNAQGAAKALAEQVERALAGAVLVGQPAQAGFYVVQGAFDVWRASRLAVRSE